MKISDLTLKENEEEGTVEIKVDDNLSFLVGDDWAAVGRPGNQEGWTDWEFITI